MEKHKCLNCTNETTNPKYCSLSCAAVANNALYPNRKRLQPQKEFYCIKCSILIGTGRKYNRKYCINCLKSNAKYNWEIVTLNEILTTLPTFQAHSRIRTKAKQNLSKSNICINCGYNKHTELCHIKSIASFPRETPIKVINDPSNLIQLCPNCHWELDNGLLDITDKINKTSKTSLCSPISIQ